MLEIPLVIWMSDAYRAKRPEKVAAIESALERPYMTDDMIHTILDLADVETIQYDKTRSVINDDFYAGRKRIANDRDYELEIRVKKE